MYRGSTTITMYERKQYLEKDKKLRMVKKKIVLIKLMADFCEEEGALYQVDGNC